MNSLEPLEFDECIVDSPAFRSNLHIHEKRLQNTSENIKKIIKEVKELTSAAKGTCTSLVIVIHCFEFLHFHYSNDLLLRFH